MSSDAELADRRRTLIWLTPAGQATLRRQREVLSEERLEQALAKMPAEESRALLRGLRSLTRGDHRDHDVDL